MAWIGAGKSELQVGVVGLGYVGLPLVLQSARGGNNVLGLDVDKDKVRALNAGQSYIKHVSAASVQEARCSNRLEATTDFARCRALGAFSRSGPPAGGLPKDGCRLCRPPPRNRIPHSSRGRRRTAYRDLGGFHRTRHLVAAIRGLPGQRRRPNCQGQHALGICLIRNRTLDQHPARGRQQVPDCCGRMITARAVSVVVFVPDLFGIAAHCVEKPAEAPRLHLGHPEEAPLGKASEFQRPAAVGSLRRMGDVMLLGDPWRVAHCSCDLQRTPAAVR